MKPEQNLWKRKIWPVVSLWQPWAHFFRVENMVGVGQGDVNYCVRGVEGWLELKVWPNRLLPTQVNWAKMRTAAGGHIDVLVETPKDIYLLPPAAYSLVECVPDIAFSAVWKLSENGWLGLAEYLAKR